ncbi:MAG: radical SAM family heme chaperone HemW [Bacilli bacterium]|nr:radical SAM family heme chaperone HemW [Bacilli bacterium]
MSIYIHIPFCRSICTYCDFAKLYHNEEWISKYLDSLYNEIKDKYKGEEVKTIYIGGGTPSSLPIKYLNKLFDIIKIFKYKDIEFTFECNIEDINDELLILLKNNKVNRFSIGVETFNEKHLKFLGRNIKKDDIINNIELSKKYFDNISIDLMYAIPSQTLEELDNDIDEFLKIDVPHISTYSLIIEPHTAIYKKIDYIDEELDRSMYDLIIKRLDGYKHYEVSNFSKVGYESIHNMTYWNNEHYYGFGLGSGGYIDNIRYLNTRNINDYIKGNYLLEEDKLDINTIIENEFILGLRKIDGINKGSFKEKYNIDINDIDIVDKLIKENKLVDDKNNIKIRYDLIYTSNSILVEFIGRNYGKYIR